MDTYQPQTMSAAEMNTLLDQLLETAKAVHTKADATIADVTQALEEAEQDIERTVGEMEKHFTALDEAERETETALETLVINEAADLGKA